MYFQVKPNARENAADCACVPRASFTFPCWVKIGLAEEEKETMIESETTPGFDCFSPPLRNRHAKFDKKGFSNCLAFAMNHLPSSLDRNANVYIHSKCYIFLGNTAIKNIILLHRTKYSKTCECKWLCPSPCLSLSSVPGSQLQGWPPCPWVAFYGTTSITNIFLISKSTHGRSSQRIRVVCHNAQIWLSLEQQELKKKHCILGHVSRGICAVVFEGITRPGTRCSNQGREDRQTYRVKLHFN